MHGKKMSWPSRMRVWGYRLLYRDLPIVLMGLLMWRFSLLTIQGSWSWSLLLRRSALLYCMYRLAGKTAVFIHESGHLLLGRLSGFSPVLLSVHPIALVRLHGKTHAKKYTVPGTAGSCMMSTASDDPADIPSTLFLCGGILMNALSAMVGLIVFCLSTAFHLRRFLIIFIVISCFFVLVNSIPQKNNVVFNDGYRLATDRKSPNARHGFWLQLRINGLIGREVRLRDVPAEWFVPPEKTCYANIYEAYPHYIRCFYLEDRHCFEEAQASAQMLLETAPQLAQSSRKALTSLILYCEMIGQCRPEVLVPLLTAEMHRYIFRAATLTDLPTQYAIARLLQEDGQKAAAQVQRKLDKLEKSYPFPNEVENIRVFMEIVDVRCEERLAAAREKSKNEGPKEKEAQWYYAGDNMPWR